MKQNLSAYELVRQQLANSAVTTRFSQQSWLTSELNQHILFCRSTVHFERFHLLFDAGSCRFRDVSGVANWLGYPDQEFSPKKFLNIIHPTHNAILVLTLSRLLEIIRSTRADRDALRCVMVANIALKNVKGEYLLFKWQMTPFYNNKSNLFIQNEFTWLSTFQNEAFRLRVLHEEKFTPVWFAELLKEVKNYFANHSFFSRKEFEILSYYTRHPTATIGKTSQAFGIQSSSIITYNKRIIQKAKKNFNRMFLKAEDVAHFLLRERLL